MIAFGEATRVLGDPRTYFSSMSRPRPNSDTGGEFAHGRRRNIDSSPAQLLQDRIALKPVVGTLYAPPFDQACLARERTRLGDAAGPTLYGVNLLRLPPDAWSSQRHWHTKEDEFVYVLSGEVMLVTDAGEETGTVSRTVAWWTRRC